MRRFVRDESGMTMALVVIMMVLIGVMGAGLLTFVTRDLESVVEVNQGQRALEMSDAGMEAARRHLANEDAKPSSYDSIRPTLCSTDPTYSGCNSSWYDNGNPNTCGQTMTFDGNQIRVCIRYLLPSATDPQTRQPNYAPERLSPAFSPDVCNDANGDGRDDDIAAGAGDLDACAYSNKRNYFRVTVRGGTGNAVRQAQAIYQTQNVEFPVAYFATRDINFNGNSTETNGVSFFANRYIYGLRTGTIEGDDYAYGNWAQDFTTGLPNAYNRISRGTTSAGVAALGGTGPLPSPQAKPSGLGYQPGDSSQKNRTGSPQLYGIRDYDRDSDLSPVNSKDFRANTWGTLGAPNLAAQPGNVITFPFETGNTAADDAIIASLKQKARDNGTYTRQPSGSTFFIDDGTDTDEYPSASYLTDTVFFVEFAEGTDDSPAYGASGTAKYRADTDNPDGVGKGTVVILNGNLETVSAGDAYQGTFIVRDVNDADSDVLEYSNIGSFNLQGFVNVEGDMSLAGNVDGFLPGSLVNGLPGLIDVNQWSWRECYNTTCD